MQPASYQTLGRIADALVHSSMLPYGVLIVGHTESNGRRENNVFLSQRRADAIRDMLVNTFKIATKRCNRWDWARNNSSTRRVPLRPSTIRSRSSP